MRGLGENSQSLLKHALQSTLLCRARSWSEHASLQSTLLCTARCFAEHAPLQSTLLCTLLCRARSWSEHAPGQSTLLVRARSCAQHASLQSTLLCRARFFAQHAPAHAPGQSTLLVRARSRAQHAPVQSTLLCTQSTLPCTARSCSGQSTLLVRVLCRARSWSEHASLHAPVHSTLLCRARFFAEHASLQHAALQSTLQTCFRAVKGDGGRVSFRGAFKRVMPLERFRGGLPGEDVYHRAGAAWSRQSWATSAPRWTGSCQAVHWTKRATRVARKGGQWSDHFERAAGACNARPHETGTARRGRGETVGENARQYRDVQNISALGQHHKQC